MFLWRRAHLSRGISCFQRKECLPERDGRRLVTGPNGACKARDKLLDFTGSWSDIISKADCLVAKKYIFVIRA